MGNTIDNNFKKDLSNKEIEAYKYKLEIRKIIFEKIFLAFIIGAAFFFANIWFEKYKEERSWQRFNQEKKLEVISEIKATFAEYQPEIQAILEGQKTDIFLDSYGRVDTIKIRNYLIKASKDMRKVIIKNSYYLTNDEVNEFSNAGINYIALASIPFSEIQEYRGYIYKINSNLRLVCRRALNLKDDDDYYNYVYDSRTDLDFLKENVKNWRKNIKREDYSNDRFNKPSRHPGR